MFPFPNNRRFLISLVLLSAIFLIFLMISLDSNSSQQFSCIIDGDSTMYPVNDANSSHKSSNANPNPINETELRIKEERFGEICKGTERDIQHCCTNNATLLYLTSHDSNRISELLNSLQALEKHYLQYWPIAVTIFSDGEFSKEVQARMRLLIPHACEVVFVHTGWVFNTPPYEFSENEKWGINNYHPEFGIGYRNMCYFYFNRIMWHKHMRNYRWYIRLDTDSFIQSSVSYDFIDYVMCTGCTYGWYASSIDADWATNELDKVTLEFLKEVHESSIIINDTTHGGKPMTLPVDKDFFSTRITPNGYTDRFIYYNNFEIVDLDWMRSDAYTKYAEYLRKSGGIFKYRWGDAPMRTLAAHLLLKKQRVCRITGFDYIHS